MKKARPFEWEERRNAKQEPEDGGWCLVQDPGLSVGVKEHYRLNTVNIPKGNSTYLAFYSCVGITYSFNINGGPTVCLALHICSIIQSPNTVL